MMPSLIGFLILKGSFLHVKSEIQTLFVFCHTFINKVEQCAMYVLSQLKLLSSALNQNYSVYFILSNVSESSYYHHEILTNIFNVGRLGDWACLIVRVYISMSRSMYYLLFLK